MTGFPGFIAKKLVARLVKQDTQFFLLVQKNFIEKAMRDVEEINQKTGTPLENFALIEGEFTDGG